MYGWFSFTNGSTTTAICSTTFSTALTVAVIPNCFIEINCQRGIREIDSKCLSILIIFIATYSSSKNCWMSAAGLKLYYLAYKY